MIDSTENLFGRTKARRKYFLKRLILVAVCTGGFFILFALKAFDGLEKKALDLFSSVSFRQTTSAPILILSISQKTLDQIGALPWPNRYHARMLEILSRRGVRAVYLDDTLFQPTSEHDDALLAAEMGRLSMPVYLPVDKGIKNSSVGQGLGILEQAVPAADEWRRPIPILESKTAGLGHRVLIPDHDGVFRFWNPEMEVQGKKFPFIALKIFQDEMIVKQTNRTSGKKLIPWDRSLWEKMPRVDYADLLNSFLAEQNGMKPTVDPEIFKDKVCWIGVTAENRTLLGRTPWGEKAVPVEVFAAIYQSIHLGEQIRILPKSISAGYFLVFVMLCLLMAGSLTGKNFWIGTAPLLILACALPMAMFFFFHFWLPGVSAILFLSISLLSILILDSVISSQERSNLFHLATRDGLTGLYVIRHFRIIMNQMTREACARREPLSVILMDIDHFKKINDTYGHPAGDMVLKKTAETIQSAVRQKRALKDVDFVARYGGEEFIVLVRRNSLENTTSRIAERIRALIQQTHFEWQGASIHVTVSLGVAILRDKENVPDPMVHRADKALYLAKKNGRNRVCTEAEI